VTEHRPPVRPARCGLRVAQALTVLVIVGASAAAVWYREHLQALAGYGYATVFLVSLVSNATIILPVPGLAVSSLMGGVFNPLLVGLVAGIGQALGELSGYMVGFSSQTLIDRGRAYDRLFRWMSRHGTLTIFVLAVIPNPVFDLAGIAAGALRFPLWRFLASCATGKVIKNVGFALAGYYGIEAVLRIFQGS
jgi:membrane protein YqaA with SNARE-associated domain